jgi:spore coat protein U-like protein
MRGSHSHFSRAAVGAVLLGLSLAGAARAATSCSIDATGAVAFGPYDWTAVAPTDSTGTITYTCDGPALVVLSQGSSGTYTARTMISGANQLTYNLYTDAARSQIWGDFSGGTTLRLVAAGTRVPITVYGRLPAGQNVPSGSYSDTLMVTFFF